MLGLGLKFCLRCLPLLITLLGSPAMGGVDPQVRHYILDHCRQYDLVFMGTTHKQPQILDLIAELLPDLTRAGVGYLGLEIGSDQQDRLDAFLAGDPAALPIALAQAVDCPRYRYLLEVLKGLPIHNRPIVRAVDLPVDRYRRGQRRDRWMAEQLDGILRHTTQARILVVLGSMHVLRQLDWQPQVPQGGPSIRTLLSQWQPQVSMFSIVNSVGGPDSVCDFARRLGQASPSRALDLDQRFEGWKLGLTRFAALGPAEPWELVEGVIVHGVPAGGFPEVPYPVEDVNQCFGPGILTGLVGDQ